ncbi:MAG: hypothetical protein B7Z20_07340 [Sphingobium sp. 32-64-5]|nr:MAG: hypothetical protein B7Z20_07340 [Sphingobium sp. 32-64-5]
MVLCGAVLAPLVARAETASLAAPAAAPIGAANAAASGLAQDDAVRCLTLAVAHEAGNQPRAGQEAVAEVVLNRLAHPSFPKSVCGVVWQTRYGGPHRRAYLLPPTARRAGRRRCRAGAGHPLGRA